MRIVCVDNGPILAQGSNRLLMRHSARFHIELARRFPGLTLAQFLADWSEEDTVADFNLTAHSELHIESHAWRAGHVGRLLSYVRALPWLVGLTRRADFLYVFLPGNLSMLFVLAARALGKPYGVYLRGEIDLSWGFARAALADARFIYATGDALRDRALPLNPSSETVAPMLEVGLDDIPEQVPLRTEPPWRLLFVGRIEDKKGIRELLQAVRALIADGMQVELDLVGGGLQLDEFIREVADLPSVRFRRVVSDRAQLAEFFRAADLFVLPTHTEGFPRVLYEAMTYGTPVLTTFVGGIPSVMVEDTNCLRLEVRNPRQLTAAIRGALDSPSLRRRLSEGGIATMRSLLGTWTETHADQVASRLGR